MENITKITFLLIISSIIISGCTQTINVDDIDLTTSTIVSTSLASSISTTIQYSSNKYACGVCAGSAPPDPDVVRDCSQLVSEGQCISYKSDKFPYHCVWSPVDFRCPGLA